MAEVIGGYDSVEEVVYLLPVLERHLGRVARIARADADDHAHALELLDEFGQVHVVHGLVVAVNGPDWVVPRLNGRER